MNQTTVNPLKRHPLAFFFLLAFSMAWIPLALGYRFPRGQGIFFGIAFFAPAIAAIIMAAAVEGKAGIKALISKLFLWQVNFKWYLMALLAPIAMELLAILTYKLFGETISSLSFTDWIRMLPAQLPGLVLFLLFLVALSSGEELGWRGFAMPRLQARFGPVWASLILGLLWGSWHLPLFWLPGSSQYGLPVPGFILATIGFTFIYTCILNGAKGSVLLASLFHAASNLVLTYGNIISPKVISDLYFSLPALAIVVFIVNAFAGSSGFFRKRSLPDEETA